ncbi:hypothetical protein [Paraburkholderia sp. J94]|uniref:hypothetical protein n=1 Tax=Paraburkholderia sp. J94 TaxID=2805441 RepID=UPI002AAF1E64|nr:hypothetical protein [Paraburkholderia sp. J94]
MSAQTYVGSNKPSNAESTAAKSAAMRNGWRTRATYEIIAALAAFRLSAFMMTAMPVLSAAYFVELSLFILATPATAAARRA